MRRRRRHPTQWTSTISSTTGTRILAEDEALRKYYASVFSHILVDEYQDTNRIQAEIVDFMGLINRNVTVVGDDAQSVYCFRGANFRNILEFPKRYPGGKGLQAGDELQEHARDPRSGQPLHLAQHAAVREEPEGGQGERRNARGHLPQGRASSRRNSSPRGYSSCATRACP